MHLPHIQTKGNFTEYRAHLLVVRFALVPGCPLSCWGVTETVAPLANGLGLTELKEGQEVAVGGVGPWPLPWHSGLEITI
jgi:hypothetical protein